MVTTSTCNNLNGKNLSSINLLGKNLNGNNLIVDNINVNELNVNIALVRPQKNITQFYLDEIYEELPIAKPNKGILRANTIYEVQSVS